jgi:hypothetical protein
MPKVVIDFTVYLAVDRPGETITNVQFALLDYGVYQETYYKDCIKI